MHFEERITPPLDNDILGYFHLHSEPFVYTEVNKAFKCTSISINQCANAPGC